MYTTLPEIAHTAFYLNHRAANTQGFYLSHNAENVQCLSEIAHEAFCLNHSAVDVYYVT